MLDVFETPTQNQVAHVLYGGTAQIVASANRENQRVAALAVRGFELDVGCGIVWILVGRI